MKKVLISVFFLFTVVIQLSGQSKPKAATKPPAKSAIKTVTPVLKNLLDSFSYAAGFTVATNMKAQGIGNINTAVMLKGIDDVFKNNKTLLTPELSNDCMQRQMGLFAAEKSKAEKAVGIAFLEENKKRPGVIVLPDGLQYEVIKNGDANSASPKAVDTVVVNYSGNLVDGTEIDNSFKRGEPAAFPLTGVIKGWIEILQLMKVGDHWKVYIPAELAWDAVGSPPTIPPNAAVIFEIILEGIRPAAAVDTPKND
jgi:FKBP-type peptidyl-prolyl cis-trans isomerase FklB